MVFPIFFLNSTFATCSTVAVKPTDMVKRGRVVEIRGTKSEKQAENAKKKQSLGRNYSRVFLCQSVFQNSTDDCARSQISHESARTAGMDIPKCD